MTAAETIAAFKNFIDQYTTARAPDPDFWINQGIEAFVKIRLKNDAKNPSSGFQINQKVRDDLSNLIESGKILSYTSSTGIAVYPTDCYQVIPNSIGCSTTETEIKENTHIYARARDWDWIFANQGNPHVKPKFKSSRLAYVESDDGITILPKLSYTEVVMTYIKVWAVFSLSSNVPISLRDKTHTEITRIAASKYLTSLSNFDGAKEIYAQNIIE